MERPFSKTTLGSSVAGMFASAIQGKTILITGVSPKGLGGTLADILAAQAPKTLVLASRTASKVQEIIDQLRSRFPHVHCIAVSLDLSSQTSCRDAAAVILNHPNIEQIDVVINNAAIMSPPTRQLSPEGIELQFATNHLGHFLLTNLIMPKIIAAAKKNRPGATRIVNVSSRAIAYSGVRFTDYNFEKRHETMPEDEQPGYAALAETGRTIDPQATYTPEVAYGQSKTANVLFSVELTDRLYKEHGILSFAVHPGALMTELIRYGDVEKLSALLEKFKSLMKSLDEGASTPLVAAFDDQLEAPQGDGTGIYLSDCQPASAPAWATNSQYAKDLWKLSEELVGQSFTA
ncbi:hypothetical protein PV08_11333 [Exophiala spinifera]|uniref:Ketoreductase (KR) domain-containing protein n=1 Tax=Exophiala spinifera TaxID=91928 RepID=A0A0D1Y652_9EURO|nr:uncharacterized protein PV08_11333 [Exophiala spinifera]KIW10371.1 hypothetical protein PV08_11333 [Exophiala spinifera]